MITELNCFWIWLHSGSDRCRHVSQAYRSTRVQRVRGNSIHHYIPRVSLWSGETLFYINSYLHIYFVTLLIYKVRVVDRLICQEFLFEEFFSHCTDLALVLCVFRSPRKEETMKTAKTTGSRVLSKDEFQAHATARFEKVMRKLNSATVS